jgi:hypothetical protein
MTKKKNSEKECVNKPLEKMFKKIATAREKGEKSVVVYTTKYSDYNKGESPMGFSSNDLKPKLYEAYKQLLIIYDVNMKLINPNDKEVAWIVNFK